MTREDAEKHIKDLYGCPPNAAMEADECLLAMLGELGLGALTDEAEIEADNYEDELSIKYGKNITTL